MEHILRQTSAALFGLNYAGLFCATMSFIRQSEEKQDVFKRNALAHFAFYLNQMALTQLKFRAYPYHLALQVANDKACSMTCLPLYALWAKNDYHYYFDKVDGEDANDIKKGVASAKSATEAVTVMSDKDMISADDERGKKRAEPQSKAEIESILNVNL